jgi:hypothetical protein
MNTKQSTLKNKYEKTASTLDINFKQITSIVSEDAEIHFHSSNLNMEGDLFFSRQWKSLVNLMKEYKKLLPVDMLCSGIHKSRTP